MLKRFTRTPDLCQVRTNNLMSGWIKTTTFMLGWILTINNLSG